MKLKKELEEELRRLKIKMSVGYKTPSGYSLFYCPDCGNPVLLNKGQQENKHKNGQSFWCAAKHSFVFSQ